MKKQTKLLRLNPETIRDLTGQLSKVRGGIYATRPQQQLQSGTVELEGCCCTFYESEICI